MVRLVDVDNPDVRFAGKIFWDMVRPGVGRAGMGPEGCITSVMQRVEGRTDGPTYIKTRNSRYILSRAEPPPTQLDAAPSFAS